MRLWAWMICPEMSALVMGAGYLAGAWFFLRVAASREWHRVAVGFVALQLAFAVVMFVRPSLVALYVAMERRAATRTAGRHDEV